MKGCLIVIDMLRDFMEEGGALYCGPAAREIIPRVSARVREYRGKGWPVIFTCDAHDPNDLEFGMFSPHAIRGTAGSEVIDDMEMKPQDHRVGKTRFSALYNTDLEGIIRREGVTELEVTGVCTSICVLFTVQGLRDRDYPVTVRRDCVADFDPEAHEFALRHMVKVLGVAVK